MNIKNNAFIAIPSEETSPSMTFTIFSLIFPLFHKIISIILFSCLFSYFNRDGKRHEIAELFKVYSPIQQHSSFQLCSQAEFKETETYSHSLHDLCRRKQTSSMSSSWNEQWIHVDLGKQPKCFLRVARQVYRWRVGETVQRGEEGMFQPQVWLFFITNDRNTRKCPMRIVFAVRRPRLPLYVLSTRLHNGE